ncbi:MAG: VWA domain-containing protein [Pseudomonadales bacterium]|nr:VWA domain-containing protein [Pseudomonadales bacterium]
MNDDEPAVPERAPRGTVTKRTVDAFLDEVDRQPPSRGRLIFGLDATASRQATWDHAAHLTARMFSAADQAGGLALRLCFFRGFREFRAGPWHRDAVPLQRAMASVRCAAGHTQIERLLRFALQETRRERIAGLILVGDACEEPIDRVAGVAGELGLLGTPVFAFQEGQDRAAREVFAAVARASGGVHARFDHSAADRLSSLLHAVAIFAAGGRDALARLGRTDSVARALLEDLPR